MNIIDLTQGTHVYTRDMSPFRHPTTPTVSSNCRSAGTPLRLGLGLLLVCRNGGRSEWRYAPLFYVIKTTAWRGVCKRLEPIWPTSKETPHVWTLANSRESKQIKGAEFQHIETIWARIKICTHQISGPRWLKSVLAELAVLLVASWSCRITMCTFR